jgi:hypothetical protein
LFLANVIGRRVLGPGSASRGSPEAVKRGRHLFGPHRQRGITAIADQPFEFDADPFRWACLEADTVDLRFRVGLGKPLSLDHDCDTT